MQRIASQDLKGSIPTRRSEGMTERFRRAQDLLDIRHEVVYQIEASSVNIVQ